MHSLSFDVFFNYIQVLSLSQVTIGQLSIGHIINLASNDVQRFDPVGSLSVAQAIYNL